MHSFFVNYNVNSISTEIITGRLHTPSWKYGDFEKFFSNERLTNFLVIFTIFSPIVYQRKIALSVHTFFKKGKVDSTFMEIGVACPSKSHEKSCKILNIYPDKSKTLLNKHYCHNTLKTNPIRQFLI